MRLPGFAAAVGVPPVDEIFPCAKTDAINHEASR
jgi:hypothetical protein